MKYFLFILFFSLADLSWVASYAQDNKLSSILSTARKENKNVFVYVHATWCIPCRLLEKNVLPLKNVADSLQEYIFVSTSLDKSDLGVLIARKYGITAVPSFLLLSPKGELLHYILGASGDSAQFLAILSQLKGGARIRGYSTDFSLSYPAFYTDFFPSFKHIADSNAVDLYFDTQQDLESEVNFNIFMTHTTGRKYLTYFLLHARNYGEKFGSLYCQRVDRLYLSNIKRIIGAKDTLLYALLDGAHYITDSIMGYDYERLRRFRYISFLGKSGFDWSGYADAIDEWEANYGSNSIRLFCDDVYLNCRTAAVCRKIARYLGASLNGSQDQDEDIYFKYAVLLHRGGEDAKAQAALVQAKNLSHGDEQKIMEQWAQAK